ncbi:MAG TPA: CHASE3 domain-containing protein [Terriglobales bacterium]|nr:CHASE3 domain-containing protein [Terriglobales bacterium]
MIRKAALRVGAPALLVLMASNAYLAVNHLERMDRIAALTLESSTIQAHISSVLKDLTDMETGQRGYLLTENPSYLQPYTDAKARIASDFAGLRAGLANRSQHERSLESQLESVASSKQAEMEHSISLRQQGYRHRAFKLVDSNEGMEYMEKARGLLSLLSAAENNNFASLDRERNVGLSKALRDNIAANLFLLLLTACLFALMRYHERVLEREAAQSRQELVVRDLQLEKLTSALSNQARSNTSVIEANARLLLQHYGGFLPRQGHEYAEQIKEASAQMERLRQDLVGSPASDKAEQAALDSVA